MVYVSAKLKNMLTMQNCVKMCLPFILKIYWVESGTLLNWYSWVILKTDGCTCTFRNTSDILSSASLR